MLDPDDLIAYRPIRDYALIGDCHGAALVSRDGAVDWCGLGRFDGDPILCRLLDARRGGTFLLRPPRPFEAGRRYVGPTNVLETTFTTDAGRVRVTDFMPVGRCPGAGVHDYVSLRAPGWLVRRVEGETGAVDLDVVFYGGRDYARRRLRLTPRRGGLVSPDGSSLVTDVALTVADDVATGRMRLSRGERRYFVLAPDPVLSDGLAPRCEALLAVTRAFWEEWAAYARYRGPYREPVLRSALTLKALTYAPSGALIAAPTTSLPEQPGGDQNWDYRYCWLRDGAFMLYALAALGYSGEGRRFGAFLKAACARTPPRLQIMYAIDHARELVEHTLGHLNGYEGSRPVRVGNAAYTQDQLDVYGEVLDWACLHESLGGRLGRDWRALIRGMVEHVLECWQRPDHGIWESRAAPRHHVFGKVMAWVAVDRAIRILGPTREWAAARGAIARAVLKRGVDATNGHLTGTLDESDIDASLLLIPSFGFPVDRPTLDQTIDAVRPALGRGEYLHRDRGFRAADGQRRLEGGLSGLQLLARRHPALCPASRRGARALRAPTHSGERRGALRRRGRPRDTRLSWELPPGADAPRPDPERDIPGDLRAAWAGGAPRHPRRPRPLHG
jgi:alpha,alpha-trehalase